MNVCESLTRTAQLYPDNVALVAGEQQLTYRALDRLSLAAAQQLVARGIQPGDRVAIRLPNTPAFVVWYYAVLRLGGIAVAVSTRLADSEVEFVVSDCQATAFVSIESHDSCNFDANIACITTSHGGDLCNGVSLESSSVETSGAGWVDRDSDEAALILYTSGTTGFAKGAVLSHGNVRSNVHAFNHLCNMRPDDRILLAVPLFHCFGQNALLNSAFNVGAMIVLQPKFDLNESKRLIREHRVSQLYGVPMMFHLLHDSCSPADLESINYCFSAAAKLPIQVAENWRQKFRMPIHEGYGLTETSPFASYNHRDRFVPGSIGTPIDNVEMRIVDPDSGEPLPVGELGEIAIRGPNVMLGYWNRPEDTAAAIRNGWFHSGDIGRMSEDGYFSIVDRVKDMIAVGGLKVFPAEVERVLVDHPLVAQAAVIGVADPVFGEQVVAFLVLAATDDDATSPSAALSSIRDYAIQHLGNYKRPRRFFLIEEFPRNPSGKVLKTTLRQMAAEQADAELPMEASRIKHFGNADSNADQQTSATGSSAIVTNDLQPPTLRVRIEAAFETQRHDIATEFLQALAMRLAQLEQPPDASAQLTEINLDSLLLVELVAQLQVEVGPDHPLSPTVVFDYPRICDLADFLVATFNDPDAESPQPPAARGSSTAVQGGHELRMEIEQMSEEEALKELLREIK